MPRLYYCDHHEIVLPPGHKFPMRKYRLVRELLAADGRFELEPAPLAAAETIALAHDPGYVSRFLDGAVEPAAMRRIGFPWSASLVRRTLASVGGTVSAARDALAAGWGGNLAGGAHHAFRGEGSGFCVFNDIAVAVRALLAEAWIRRAAVLDLDVHQGDGAAEIFSGDDRVLTISVHGRNNFPFRKRRSRIDVDLEDGAGDAEFLDAVSRVLPEVGTFAPDIVFYQSGVDGLAADRLGRLALTPAGVAERDRRALGFCRERGLPAVVVLGGGYSEPIEITARAHAETFRIAAEVWRGGTSERRPGPVAAA